MESRHYGQDKIIFFCPVHNASTPCSLQAFGIRCIKMRKYDKLTRIACPSYQLGRERQRRRLLNFDFSLPLYLFAYSKHPHIRTHDFGGQAD